MWEAATIARKTANKAFGEGGKEQHPSSQFLVLSAVHKMLLRRITKLYIHTKRRSYLGVKVDVNIIESGRHVEGMDGGLCTFLLPKVTTIFVLQVPVMGRRNSK